jgi:CRISPR type IV-associated protein Csf3
MCYKIRFYLNTPLCFTTQKKLEPLKFDGILGYAWAIKNGLNKTPAETVVENIVFPELPLEKYSNKCYCASSMFSPKESFFTPITINRVTDYKSTFHRHNVSNMQFVKGSNWYKGCQEFHWEFTTPYIDFYFKGDLKKVEKLISIIFKIRHLGVKRSVGYGHINEIVVAKTDEDWSVWKDGMPTRTVPISIVGERQELIKEFVNYYPPYWVEQNKEWCYIPPINQWMPQIENNELENKLKMGFDKNTERIKERAEANREKDNKKRNRRMKNA